MTHTDKKATYPAFIFSARSRFLLAARLRLRFCSDTLLSSFLFFRSQRSIETLQSEISALKLENDAAYKRITASIDLKAVKKQAKKLGMKYPTDQQIKYYTIENADYMTQYSD